MSKTTVNADKNKGINAENIWTPVLHLGLNNVRFRDAPLFPAAALFYWSSDRVRMESSKRRRQRKILTLQGLFEFFPL